MERLRAGSLDVVVGRWDFLPRDVDSRVVAREELLVALSDDHRMAGAEAVSPSELADEPWVGVPRGQRSDPLEPARPWGCGAASFRGSCRRQTTRPPNCFSSTPERASRSRSPESAENIPAHAVVFRPLQPDLGTVEVRIAWRAADDNPALAAVIAASESLYPDVAVAPVSGRPGTRRCARVAQHVGGLRARC